MNNLCYKDKKKWYENDRFPLVPQFGTRPQDEWNPSSFYFHWLNIRIWSLISLTFSIEFFADDEGVAILGAFLYIRWVVWLAIFPASWHQKLWRKGNKGSKGSQYFEEQP